MPAIVVHGGAGARPAQGPEADAARAGCESAAAAGHAILAAGGCAVDAVQRAVRALEDDERFNAGRGSCLTRAGTVEMDAAIMIGAGLRAGAVGAVTGVRNPIDLARRVLDDGEHVLLVGAGALEFARETGVALTAPDHHVTEKARADLARELARRAPASGGGTVGAVAVDAAGHVAAATSTGGMVGKRPGRVGDTPLPGAGTYADDEAGAASATGHGERIIQVALTKTAIELLRAGLPAPEAAARALASLDRVAGRAGLIVVDRHGGTAAVFNTASMAWAALP
ncbi:MAG TPA: isoaspartyl peptidase/L-asparaginase [Polyangia bacterium]|jgi:beta-aspartyl-peptidase (threonine type)|nr:isoaspartyl peptidase/L-asparaginase [Polyangia bacterium]